MCYTAVGTLVENSRKDASLTMTLVNIYCNNMFKSSVRYFGSDAMPFISWRNNRLPNAPDDLPHKRWFSDDVWANHIALYQDMKTRGPKEPNVFKYVADVLTGRIDTDFDDKFVGVCNEGDSGFPVEGLAAALPKLSPPVNATAQKQG